MMKGNKILASLLVILMMALTGCQTDPETTPVESGATTTESATQPSAGDTTPVTTEGETLDVGGLEQLEDCLNWLDKMAEELGIPEGSIRREDTFYEVDLAGKLFGLEAKGLAELKEGMGSLMVSAVYLTCEELTYEEGLAKLTALYGAPIQEKTDKSGQTDQGIVTYAVFANGEREIWLSKGTEESFVHIESY